MKKRILAILALCIYLSFLTPLINDWNTQVNALALLVIMQILWIGKVLPYVQTTLILMVLLSIHFYPFEKVVGYLGSGIVWLVFATYIISKAFMKSGLAQRFSLQIIRFSRGSGKLLLLASYILMIVLAVIIPSNIGRTSLIASSLDQIVKHLETIMKVNNLAKGMFVGVAILTGVSGVFVATGASSTIYTYGLIEESSSFSINYINWILFFALPVFLFIIALWITTLFIFPVENINKDYLFTYIESKITDLGPLSKTEIKMLCIIGITVILWVFNSQLGLSIPMVGILGSLLTLLPYIGIWDWDEAQKSVNWEMFLFFGSTLMLSNMLIDSGILESFTQFLLPLFEKGNKFITILIIVLAIMLLRIIFVNVLGFLTIMIPLALTLGGKLNVGDPTLFTMIVFLAGVPGFFLVTQSPSHIISYSYEYFSSADLFKVGSVLSILWIVIIMLSFFILWPLAI